MKAYKYDIIVIGSGIGGLMTGALLSKNRKVLVLEKESVFGGYCASFMRGGFNFEIAIEAINGLNKGQVIYDMFKRSGVLNKSNFVTPKDLYRSIYPDYDLRFPQRDINSYKKVLHELFKKDKDGIDRLIEEMGLIYKEIDRLDRQKKLVKSPNIMKYYSTVFEELLNTHIKDTKLKAILSQYWVYCGVPPSMLSSVTFSYIWYDYTCNGSFYPAGGTGRLADEFVDIIKKNGGEALLNSKVLKMYNKNDKISEIELANGEHFSADIFISNIDINQTFNIVTEKNDKIRNYIKKINLKHPSISACKIYLGLNANLKKMGITDFETFVNPSYDLDKMYAASMSNDINHAPISVVIYSNVYNTVHDDKSVVSIAMLSGYDFWKKLNKNSYEIAKEKMAENLIKKAEIVIPGLRGYIKERIMATPLTMERHTGNMRGAIYGWARGNLYDEIRFMKTTTPIKNLFLASHWTKIGGGIAGVIRASERVYRLIKK